MNNMIRDMALDVMVKYVNDGDGWSFSTEELEKLGEMIVRECSRVGNNVLWLSFDNDLVGREIRKHFGVD